MKYIKTILAAVLAISLTACSFFNNQPNNENPQVTEASTTSEATSIYCLLELTGGSGKATVESPAEVNDVEKTVKLVWSSSHYDYMLVDDKRYDNEAAEGENSVFTIPFPYYNRPFTVIGDTTAMSTPHEIEYELTVHDSYETVIKNENEAKKDSSKDLPVSLGNLQYDSSLELKYAKEYTLDYYKDNKGSLYAFITLGSDSDKQYFLRALEGGSKPGGLSSNVVYIEGVDKTYLVSTSVMDLICKIDAVDNIHLCGTKSKDWHIKEAKERFKSGDIIYAGKYSAPDYELLVTEGCNLAIENTMIYHNPEAKEKLEELGIPVMVERSSYESNPLGRIEWIKLYGVLYGKSDVAADYFDKQLAKVEDVGKLGNTNKTVAFFSVNSNGQIIVRKPGDYISSMINMAGGKYIPDDIKPAEENALSTMKITTEDFYIRAVDADVLIFNSTIEGEIESIDELIKLEPSLADFKAVKEKNVYCLEESYFQKTTKVAEFIEETHEILTGSFKEGQCFFKIKE